MNDPKPRGRPRTFDRQAALDAAMKLFWQYGYEGTSIADLTDAMGVTPPTLYAAFGSKEHLYRDVLMHYLLRGEGYAQREIRETESAYDAIEQYLHLLARHFTDPTTPAGCMVQTASLYCAAENEAARSAAASVRAASFAQLIAKLESAKHSGELPSDTDVHALARFYSAIVQGMSVQAIDGASTAELNDLVNVAMLAWPGKRPLA